MGNPALFTQLFYGGGAAGAAASGSIKSALAKPRLPTLGATAGSTDAAAAASAEQERLNLSRRRGRAATILTGPLGDLNPAPLGRKILTGE